MPTRGRITVVARTGHGRNGPIARWPSWPVISKRGRSMLVSLAVAAIVGVGSAPAWAVAQGGAPARPGNVTIYLAPASKGGKDSNTGLTPSSPILTLIHAQQVLTQLNPTGNVTVRITQGTYLANAITWHFYVPGHTISFMPVNYTGGGRPPGGDPAFVDPLVSKGKHVGQTWFTAVLPPAPSPLHDGGSTGLRFYYLAIEDYTQGISFNGQAGHSWHDKTSYTRPSLGVNDNAVSGMTFDDIGDLFAPVGPKSAGYGVILFTDSSGNSIVNNTFDHIYNSGDHDQLHPLYITHFSSSNTVEKNLFENTNGEAIKVRDRSNGNNIVGNTFNATGGVAAYLDDFCDKSCANVNVNPKKYRECASYGNRFTGNTIVTGPVFDLIPPGQTNAGGAPCSIPAGQVRVTVAGNKR
jgi:Right handed beta helix region